VASAQERGNTGRVVLVTGAACGIGRAVTIRCPDAGMKVVAVDQDEDALGDLFEGRVLEMAQPSDGRPHREHYRTVFPGVFHLAQPSEA
jgi:NAD(P)-dependent dehydrogenase (short-subunit alcohol dehydrogenase family)